MYQLIEHIDQYSGEKLSASLKRLADNAFIPFDPANTDFVEYQRWLAEGNEVLPPDEQE